MALDGKAHLQVVHDESHDALVGRTIRELLDQRAALLGALIDRDVRAIADQYRGGLANLDPRERRVIEDEARGAWAKKAAGIGDRTSYQRLLELGRGEDTTS